MSVIAVDGVPQKMSLNHIVKLLVKSIRGHFEALNFHNHPNKAPYKTCYLRLSQRLNKQQVIDNINNAMTKNKKLFAYIPNSIPNFSVAKKRKVVPSILRKKLMIHPDFRPDQILFKALEEIMKELQHKYTGLYNLSSKTQHQLLENIGLTIAERLKKLLSTAHPNDLSFKLTGRYRVAHPHFGDFQLILAALGRSQPPGKPRIQVTEQELMATPKDLTTADNVPFTKGQEICTKYTERILEKLKDYVSKFDVTSSPDDTEETAARKTIQKHIANVVPYLPAIVRQVAFNHFMADGKGGLQKMRLYGEPYLPGKEVCIPFLKRQRASRVLRCSAVFNCLLFDIPRDQYVKIMAADGTTMGESKVVIRPAATEIYQLSQEAQERIAQDIEQMFSTE